MLSTVHGYPFLHAFILYFIGIKSMRLKLRIHCATKEKAALKGGLLYPFSHTHRYCASCPIAGIQGHLHVLFDFSGFEAARTYLYMAHCAILECPHLDKVREPGSARAILRMRHIISEKRSLTADFTNSGHSGCAIVY